MISLLIPQRSIMACQRPLDETKVMHSGLIPTMAREQRNSRRRVSRRNTLRLQEVQVGWIDDFKLSLFTQHCARNSVWRILIMASEIILKLCFSLWEYENFSNIFLWFWNLSSLNLWQLIWLTWSNSIKVWCAAIRKSQTQICAVLGLWLRSGAEDKKIRRKKIVKRNVFQW
jgi:hypothetical protein